MLFPYAEVPRMKVNASSRLSTMVMTRLVLVLLPVLAIGACSSGKGDISGGIDLPSAQAELEERLELTAEQGVEVGPILEAWLMDRNVVFHAARNVEQVNMPRTRDELATINNTAILQLKPLLDGEQLEKFKKVIDGDWEDFRSEIRGENAVRQDPMGGQGMGGDRRGY
jgi:hypothetical protein